MDTSTNQSIGVSGTGSLTQLGTGTLALNGANSASTVALTNGEIQLATGATMNSTGDLTMGSSTKLDLNGNNATFGGLSGGGVIDNVNAPSAVNTLSFGSDNNSNAFSGVIQNSNSSTMSVVKSGTGTETLSGLNTFSGGLTITGGQVIVNQTNGVGSGTITDNTTQGLLLGNGVTLSNAITDGAGSAEFEDVAAGGSGTLSGTISVTGSGQFRAGTSNTSSTLNLTGTSTGTASQVYIFTRGNVVVSGTGSIASGDTASAFLIGRYNGTSTLNLTLNNTANVSSVDGITLGVGNAADDDVNINVTLNGTSTMTAGGNFELNNDSTTTSGTGTSVTLNGTSSAGPTLTANSFTFSNNSGASGTALTVNGGTITAGASDVYVSTGTVSYTPFMPYFSNPNLNITNEFSFVVGSGGLTVNNGGFNITLAQNMSDGGGGAADTVTYTGTGTTVLANFNNYGGNTTLNAGTLVIANNSGSATSSGTVTLNGGVLASANSTLLTELALPINPGTDTSIDYVTAAAPNAGNGTISGIVKAGSGASTVAPGGIGPVGTLTVGGLAANSNMAFDFDLGTPELGGDNGDLIIISGGGSFSASAGTPIEFSTGPTQAGDYELFDLNGATSPTLSNFTLPSVPGFTVSLSTTVQSGFIDLVVAAGPTAVFWDNAGGSGNGTTWDTSNQNWNNGSAATTYANGDAVTFNDTNAGHYFVTLASTVSPASVTVNSSGNYSITGGGLIVATGGFTKSNTSTLTLGVGLTTSSLAINGGNVVFASNTSAGSGWVANNATHDLSNINITSLTIASGSVLDITNNHLFIDYGSSDPIGTILGYLKAGFNNGGWNGTTGIISSTAQTLTNNLKYGIGWADGNDKTGAVAGLSSGEIELKYTLLGDANLDGTVNGSDFSILAANFGLGLTNWDQGNFLYSSSVNGSDFSALAANFGQGDSGAAVTVTPADVQALDAFAAANGLPAPTIAAVPEPATLGLLAMGATGLLARRRRKA